MNNVQKIIKEICDEKNINFKLVSKDWIIILEKNGITKYIVGYKFPLNDQASGKICDDKYALYDVIKQFCMPVCEHYIVFKNYDKDEIIKYCKKYEFNMVIKNNTGTCGNDMYHVLKKQDVLNRIDELLAKNYSVSISPFYNIKTEYRVIVLNNNAELVYGKKRPIVVGDDKSTIYELLCAFNTKYFSSIQKDESLNKVLGLNEVYEYNWQFNLSKGSIPFMLNDENKEKKIKEMAIKIAKILGVSFASIDIIELVDGSMLLLEANSGVMMDKFSELISNGKEIAKNIYTKAIEYMFNENSNN